MVVEMVPLKGGIGSIFHPPEGKDYKWYISGIFPANWGIKNATDPTLLGEPFQQPLKIMDGWKFRDSTHHGTHASKGFGFPSSNVPTLPINNHF